MPYCARAYACGPVAVTCACAFVIFVLMAPLLMAHDITKAPSQTNSDYYIQYLCYDGGSAMASETAITSCACENIFLNPVCLCVCV